MSKRIEVIVDETTGEYHIDMSGYEGDDCRQELAAVLAALREEGIEVDSGDVKKKPPQTAYSASRGQKAGGK